MDIKNESTTTFVVQHQHHYNGDWMDWYAFDDLDGVDHEKRAREYLVSKRFASPAVNWRLITRTTTTTEKVIA